MDGFWLELEVNELVVIEYSEEDDDYTAK